MARCGHRASAPPEESVGRAGVDPLSLRHDRVARDRLLGECVAPSVAVACFRILFEELLRVGRLEGCQHVQLVELGHLDEQPVVEGAPEDGGPQHIDVLRVEPPEA
jgi:hypothetical protein